MTQLSRRSLITGLISLVAAPAIVRAGSLMPVKVMEPVRVSDLIVSFTAQVDHYASGEMQDAIGRIYFLERKPGESQEDFNIRRVFAVRRYAFAGLGHRFDPIKAFGWA
ncbi:hypothetical protein [Bradyrhizobium sp.]